MQDTSRGQRLHIGIFGKRNAGKSSLINALTNQDIALVSDTPGTTTDPVYKTMEILPIGPVVIIDTAGLDDTGELGEKRVMKSLAVLNKCDIALVVTDAQNLSDTAVAYEKDLIIRILDKKIPVLLVINKTDLNDPDVATLNHLNKFLDVPMVKVSCQNKSGIETLKKLLIENSDSSWQNDTILGDIVSSGDIAVLVVPIDDAAPKGRLILPQVQTIRDILDNDAIAITVKERELSYALSSMAVKPKIVITDSQAFQKVSADTPPDILLTSFSILFARYKGDLELYLGGIRKIKELKDGDRILIAESCTHHVQSDDIGTVKIPRWLRDFTGRELTFEKFSGCNFPDNLSDYALAIHCGGCMLNRREILYRLRFSNSFGVPITNYGMIIAYIFGILERALKPFPIAQAIYSGDIY